MRGQLGSQICVNKREPAVHRSGGRRPRGMKLLQKARKESAKGTYNISNSLHTHKQSFCKVISCQHHFCFLLWVTDRISIERERERERESLGESERERARQRARASERARERESERERDSYAYLRERKHSPACTQQQQHTYTQTRSTHALSLSHTHT